MAESVLLYKPEFPGLLGSYCEQMKEAVKQEKLHDHRQVIKFGSEMNFSSSKGTLT